MSSTMLGGIGFYSLIAARLGATVFTFEPDPENADLIEFHLKINDLSDKVTLIRKAVLSFTGEVNLIPATWGEGHGNAVVAGNAENTLQVACVTLDDFMLNHLAPDMIKVDVEGAESEVLKGATHVFEKIRPIFICEIHDETNCEFVVQWLKDRNYAFVFMESEDSPFPKHLFALPGNCQQTGWSERRL